MQKWFWSIKCVNHRHRPKQEKKRTGVWPQNPRDTSQQMWPQKGSQRGHGSHVKTDIWDPVLHTMDATISWTLLELMGREEGQPFLGSSLSAIDVSAFSRLLFLSFKNACLSFFPHSSHWWWYVKIQFEIFLLLSTVLSIAKNFLQFHTSKK